MTVELPGRARLVEVGMRDGLQAVPQPLTVDAKLYLLERLIEAGLREVEITSFAHPRVLPQFSDAEELVARAPRVDGVRYRALVPNVRGAQRASQCQLDEMVFVIPAEDGMAMKNQGRSVDQLLDDVHLIGALCADVGQELVVAVACAFFSPCYGEVSQEARHRVIAAAQSAGAAGAYLANTSGQETPREVHEGIAAARAAFPALSFGSHLHNRNGFAAANALAALAAGADWLESSFGGLGGDLWFPGDPTVLGNMATEDLVHLLQGSGIETGVDLESVRALAEDVYQLTGFPRTSFVCRGGTRKELGEARWPR